MINWTKTWSRPSPISNATGYSFLVVVVNNLFPVFTIIMLGAALRHLNITNQTFLTTSDRLVYYIFFPALLFWKIGSADLILTSESIRFYTAVIGSIIVTHSLSICYIKLFNTTEFQAGTFSQSCYRFNTYIGMAVILTVWGEQSAAQFGILIGIAIPIVNIMAVTTLIWFSGQSLNWRGRLHMTFSALITNPLILACIAAIAYARWIQMFPLFLENTLKLGAAVTLPLALLSIGGNLTLKTVKGNLPLALIGSGFKLVLLPIIGWLLMRLLNVTQTDYFIGMLFFTLPTSSVIYVLSTQLNSDSELASAAIVISTGLSFFSMSMVLWWFHNS